jgi:hypothetical protein
MKCTYRDRLVAVYDAVLSRARFDALWRYMQTASYAPVHEGSYRKAWRPADGVPLRGTTYLSKDVFPGSRLPVLPSRTPVDTVVAVTTRAARGLGQLVGRAGRDWIAVSATPYLYPPGTGLSWHADENQYRGSYVFYAHPEWNASWGGELLVSHGRPSRRRGAAGARAEADMPFLRVEEESERLVKLGLGMFIVPAPNRLVVVGGDVPHMVNRVSSAAGNHVRASLAGFFFSARQTSRAVLPKTTALSSERGDSTCDSRP